MPVFRAFPDLPLAELGLIIALAQHSRQPSHFVFLGPCPTFAYRLRRVTGSSALMLLPAARASHTAATPCPERGENWGEVDPQKFWCYCNYASLRACVNVFIR